MPHQREAVPMRKRAPLLAQDDKGRVFIITKYAKGQGDRVRPFEQFDVTNELAGIIDRMNIPKDAKDAVLAALGVMRKVDLGKCPSCGEAIPQPKPGQAIMDPFVEHMTTKHGATATTSEAEQPDVPPLPVAAAADPAQWAKDNPEEARRVGLDPEATLD